MNGPMFTILALCGVWLILRNVDCEDTWKSRFGLLAKALGLYLLIGICLIVLYSEVVLRWLVF